LIFRGALLAQRLPLHDWKEVLEDNMVRTCGHDLECCLIGELSDITFCVEDEREIKQYLITYVRLEQSIYPRCSLD